MTDKDFAALSSSDIEWAAEVDPGKYGFYKHEKESVSDEIALRRGRGVTVWAQTAFFARQRGATTLGLAPEHVKVTPCDVKKTIKKTEEAMREGCQSFVGDTTSPGTSSGTALGSKTQPSRKQSSSTRSTRSTKTELPPLSNGAVWSLEKVGVRTLEDLTKKTEAEIRCLRGIGQVTVYKLKCLMASKGWGFLPTKKGKKK